MATTKTSNSSRGRCHSSRSVETVRSVASAEVIAVTSQVQHGDHYGVPSLSLEEGPQNMQPVGPDLSSQSSEKTIMQSDEDEALFISLGSGDNVQEELLEGQGSDQEPNVPRHLRRQYDCEVFVLFNAGDLRTSEIWAVLRVALPIDLFQAVVSIQRVYCKWNNNIRYDIFVKNSLSAGFKRSLYAGTRKNYQGNVNQLWSYHNDTDSVENSVMRRRMFSGEFNKWRIFLQRLWRDRKYLLNNPMPLENPEVWQAINIATVNINGFKSKRGEFNTFMINEMISICAVQETLVRGHTYPVEVRGYNAFVRHYKEGFRGHALLVKDSLAAYEVGDKSDYYIHVKVNGIKTAKGAIHVIAVYLPSGSINIKARRTLLKQIRKELAKVYEKNKDTACYVLGDFNLSVDLLNKELKTQKSGLAIMKTKGSALSRFPKFGWSRALDHIVANPKGMALLRPPRVMRKYEMSDHRPVMSSFRVNPAEVEKPQGTYKWDMGKFKVFAKDFVNHNRWAVLNEQEVENSEDLDKLTQQMAETYDSVADDLQLKKLSDNKPPMFKKHIRKILKRKNKLAANIALDYSQGRKPCDSLLKKFEAAQDHFHKVQKEWRKDLRRKDVQNLCEAVRSNEMKKVWSNLKNRMGMKKSSQLGNPVRDKKGNLCVTQDEILVAVTEHYNHLVNGDPGTSRNREYWAQVEMDPSMGEPAGELEDLNQPITWREILMAIRRMKRGTAPGNDGLQSDVLKELLHQECFESVNQKGQALQGITYAPEESELPWKPLTQFGQCLFKIITKTWELEKCPELWDEITLCNLFKSGNPELLVNYRGISLISVGLKTLLSVIADRLYSGLEKRDFFSKWQSGFRRKEEAVAQFISIAEVIRRRGIKSKPTATFGVFIDFKKAFDKVHHEALYRILDHVGVRGKALEFIRALYTNAKIKVRSGGKLSESFGMLRGNRQGCPMSPLLFDILVNFILEECGTGVGDVNEDPCMGGQFADDLVALCESMKDVQTFLTKLYNWCNKWGMEIGPQKSGVMMFGGSEQLRAEFNSTTFKAGPDDIPRVTEYKYLGIIMGEDMIDSRKDGGSEEKHAKTLAARGMKKLWAMRPLLKDQMLPMQIKVDLIKTFLISAMSYGGEWLGFKGNNAVYQQRVVNKALKIAAGVSSDSPLVEAFTMSIELGIPQIEVIQNGLRTRLQEKIKAKEIKTFLRYLNENPHCNRKWTWVTTNSNWTNRYGDMPELPLWQRRCQAYETHVRCNNYSWPLISHLMAIEKGLVNDDFDPLDEDQREDKLREVLVPDSEEFDKKEYDLQVSARAGNKNHEQAAVIDKVKQATLARKMASNNSQAWEHYTTWSLGATRGYIKTALAYPRLAKGVSWLMRLRTKSYPRVDMHWNKLNAAGKKPHFEKDQCPLCRCKIDMGMEWIHLLVVCKHPKVKKYRSDKLSEPLIYIDAELGLSPIVCEDEPSRTTPNLFGEVGINTARAVLLIGGTINNWFESFFHLGYGQLDDGARGLRTYGFVYVAEFLREVMPLYLEALYNGGQSDYKLMEVLVEGEESDLPLDSIYRDCLEAQGYQP